jgi:hypothetical protein
LPPGNTSIQMGGLAPPQFMGFPKGRRPLGLPKSSFQNRLGACQGPPTRRPAARHRPGPSALATGCSASSWARADPGQGSGRSRSGSYILGGPLAATQPVEKFVTKPDLGGPTGPCPKGGRTRQLMGLPDGRGRVDRQNRALRKNVSMGWVARGPPVFIWAPYPQEAPPQRLPAINSSFPAIYVKIVYLSGPSSLLRQIRNLLGANWRPRRRQQMNHSGRQVSKPAEGSRMNRR